MHRADVRHRATTSDSSSVTILICKHKTIVQARSSVHQGGTEQHMQKVGEAMGPPTHSVLRAAMNKLMQIRDLRVSHSVIDDRW